MLLTSLLLFFIAGNIEVSNARSLHLSVNLTLALNDEKNQQQPQEQLKSANFSPELLNYCMKETEISMNELSRYRLSLLANEDETVNDIKNPNEESNYKTVDYDSTLAMIEERNQKPLQCFIHCLYERLGLIKNGVLVEADFFRKFYSIVEHVKKPIKECINMESKNNCESAYKMHLCHRKLKNLEAENRIREILEYNDNDYNNNNNNDTYDIVNDENSSFNTDLTDLDAVDPQENEIDNN